MSESPPEEETVETTVKAPDGTVEKPTGKKRGRPPKPGGARDLELQLDKLKGMAHLPPDEFKIEAQKHIQGLLGLVTGKLYERIDELSPTNLAVLYGILMDKHAASTPVPQSLHLTQITVNGVDRAEMKRQLAGMKKAESVKNSDTLVELLPPKSSEHVNLKESPVNKEVGGKHA